MWAAVLGIVGKLLSLLPLIGAWMAGRDRQRAVEMEKGLEGLDRARKSVDHVAGDADSRERLRDRYRADG
jgi:hypothetical protein